MQLRLSFGRVGLHNTHKTPVCRNRRFRPRVDPVLCTCTRVGAHSRRGGHPEHGDSHHRLAVRGVRRLRAGGDVCGRVCLYGGFRDPPREDRPLELAACALGLVAAQPLYAALSTDYHQLAANFGVLEAVLWWVAFTAAVVAAWVPAARRIRMAESWRETRRMIEEA
jgi:hypothetical protein